MPARKPQQDPFERGVRTEADRRDEGLSPAALEVRARLEEIARDGHQFTAVGLTLALAQFYIPARLRRRHRTAR